MVFLNKDQLIKLLLEILSEYESFVTFHSSAITELIHLLGKSGSEKQFLVKFTEYLSKLQTRGEQAIGGKGNPLEHLKGESPLCSMRFPFSGSNIRVLFVYQDEHVYILTAFYEREGHRKTEYSAHTPAARQRFGDLTKER